MGRINTYNILIGKPQEKCFERPRYEQGDNIKIDISEIGCENLNSDRLVQDTNNKCLKKTWSVQHGGTHQMVPI